VPILAPNSAHFVAGQSKKSVLFIGITLCEICLFEFIRMEGGAKFMEHFKGGWGTSYKSFGTTALRQKTDSEVTDVARITLN
jgi:hypothetical protein